MTTGAACRGTDTEDFYNPHRWSTAAKLCRDCPVKLACRIDFAHDTHAYAGGMTPNQRRAWVNRDAERKAAAQALAAAEEAAREEASPSRPPRTQKATPDEVVQEIFRIFDSELIGAQALADRVGVSKSTVQRHLRLTGRKRTVEQQQALSQAGRDKACGSRANEKANNLAMIEKLGAEGYSAREMVELTGLHRKTVYYLRRELGLNDGWKKTEKIRRMLADGMTRAEVVRATGLSPQRIRDVDNEYKRELRGA